MVAANPQGKGLSITLSSLHACRPSITVPPKQILQVSNEWFTSMFILGSRFHFKPVVNKQYWLYRIDEEEYFLSLISPTEWHDGKSRFSIGACRLQADLTWTLNISQQAEQDRALQSELCRKWQNFQRKLTSASTLEEQLPVYDSNLGYYARVFAAGMAYSLRSSMQQTGILRCDYRTARKQLAQF